MSNNSYLENWIETISNLNNGSSEVETSQYSTSDWIYLGFNIIGVALILGLPIGYAVYKSRCCYAVKTIGNEGIGDNISVDFE